MLWFDQILCYLKFIESEFAVNVTSVYRGVGVRGACQQSTVLPDE